MAVNINGDTGIDKVQPGTIDSADFGPGSVTAPAIASGAITEAKLESGAGSAGQLLSSSGSGALTWVTAAAGGFSNMQVFTSPGTWTNPGNVEKVKVTVIGGGGGFTEVNDNAGNNRAGTGGTSSFGAYCSATGGQGAFGYALNPGYRAFGAGAGGSGSGGDLNLRGGDGDSINGPIGQTVPGVTGARGGSSFMGAGACIHRDLGFPQGGNNALIQVAGIYGGGGIGFSGSYGFGGAGGGGTAIEVIPFPTATNVPVTVGAAGTPYTASPQVNDYQQVAGAGVVIVEY